MLHSGRPAELLLIGDDPSDARLTWDALAHGLALGHVSLSPDRVEAMRFLRRESPDFTSAPRPDLILLNVPHHEGGPLLEEIKSDQRLRRIPVMVLSSSETPEDLQNIYSLHANCYIRKPALLDEFIEVVRSIERFWFGIVTLPTR